MIALEIEQRHLHGVVPEQLAVASDDFIGALSGLDDV